MRILIIEDERSIAEALCETLKKSEYLVDSCYDGETGLFYALTGIYDLLIVDLMLPKKNGLDLIKEIRQAKIDSKIIILSAKNEEDTKVIGFTLGADDYVTKPFSPKELLARVRASLRRQGETMQTKIVYEGLEYDLGANILSYNSKSISLKNKEAHLMQELIKARGTIVAKESLFDKVWGFDSDNDYNAIEVYLSFLRKKLKYIDSDVHISVLRGMGYYLEKRNDKENPF